MERDRERLARVFETLRCPCRCRCQRSLGPDCDVIWTDAPGYCADGGGCDVVVCGGCISRACGGDDD
jgi:hypothetical protein